MFLVLTKRLQLSDLRILPDGWYSVSVACFLIFLGVIISQLRLWIFLRAVDVHVSLGHVIQIGLASWFINSTMLGGIGFIGSDVVRAAYLAQHSNKHSEIIGAVLIDRVVGLIGLLSLSSLGLMIGLHSGISDVRLVMISLPIYGLLTLTAIAAGLLIIARILGRMAAGITTAMIFIAVVIFAQNRHEVWSGYRIIIVVLLIFAAAIPAFVNDRMLARWAGTDNRIGRFIIGILMTLVVYRKKFGTLLLSYLTALCSQSLSIIALFVLAHGIEIKSIPTPEQILFSAPVALLTSMLPLPANGLGVGEAAFDEMLRLSQGFGSTILTGGAALYLAYRILGLLMALTGLPFFLSSKRSAVRSIK